MTVCCKRSVSIGPIKSLPQKSFLSSLPSFVMIVSQERSPMVRQSILRAALLAVQYIVLLPLDPVSLEGEG